MTLKGRRKLLSQQTTESLQLFDGVANLINVAMQTHRMNKIEIDYLQNYVNGVQPILSKEKLIRDEINNIMVINHAKRITRTIVGYFLGNPIQYIQAGANGKDEIDKLNRILEYEDKSTVDAIIGEHQSNVGTAYRIIYTTNDNDEIPFEDRALNPSNTFVVYTNDVTEKPLAGVTYHDIYDDSGEIVSVRYYAYTETGRWVIDANRDGIIEAISPFEFSNFNVGGVPIIEYPNNIWRMGDWESATSLMETINTLQSGRMDDIEQVIESLLVFINAEIDTEMYDEMREKGVVMLKNTTNQIVDVKSIVNSLDQNAMSTYASELENSLDIIVGIPSRNQRGGGGGDTGQAVELRDGWADLEIVARNKEAMFKRSEKRALKIILTIMRNKMGMQLSIMDLDIKFSRNKNHNLLVKTQSFQTLLGTKTLTPSDCLTIVDLVSDVNEFTTRGKIYWDEQNAIEEAKEEVKLDKERQIAEASKPVAVDKTVGPQA